MKLPTLPSTPVLRRIGLSSFAVAFIALMGLGPAPKGVIKDLDAGVLGLSTGTLVVSSMTVQGRRERERIAAAQGQQDELTTLRGKVARYEGTSPKTGNTVE